MPNHAIVVTLDANYFSVLWIFLDSLARNWPNHPEIVVFEKDFTPEQRVSLETRYRRLRLLDIRSLRVPGGPGIRHLSIYDPDVFYARFMIWTGLFDDYDTILYLGIDALVLRPLDALLETEHFLSFAESYRGNQPLFYDHQDPDLIRLLQEDSINDLPSPPANAGVLVIPRACRTPEAFSRLCYLTQRYQKHIIWGDQSAINLWMASYGLKPVEDFRYNYQIRLIWQNRERQSYRNAFFLHFNGMHISGLMTFMLQFAYVCHRILPGGRRVFPVLFGLIFHPTFMKRYRYRRLLGIMAQLSDHVFWWPKRSPPSSRSSGNRARQV